MNPHDPTKTVFPENPYHPLCWIKGDAKIGPDCWIGPFTLIDASGGLTLGRGCDVSSGAKIISHSSVRRCVSARKYPVVDYAPVEIGDHVFVGTDATILMGARIGSHSVIGAGTLVPEHFVAPPYSLIVGQPARIVRSLRDEIEQWKGLPS